MSRTSHTTAIDRLAAIRKLPERYLREASEAVAERQRELGKRIARARRLKGWKQKHLAAAVNVEPTTVSRWETGVHTPDLDMLEVIARELEQQMSYFVDEPITAAETNGEMGELALVRQAVVEALGKLDQILELLRERAA